MQQKAAKRRGHGCEAALASAISGCGGTIVPSDRATNPMGSNDPHLELATMTIRERSPGKTHAFDLVVNDTHSQPAILCQSLIHTSDPGQFGVDKSNETVEIAKRVADWNAGSGNHSVELWGLVDGVGFSENKPDTINKLIRHFDHFMQIKTLYKAPLRLHDLGLVSLVAIAFSDYYDDEDVDSICQLYVPSDVAVVDLSSANPSWQAVEAGEATIFIENTATT